MQGEVHGRLQACIWSRGERRISVWYTLFGFRVRIDTSNDMHRSTMLRVSLPIIVIKCCWQPITTEQARMHTKYAMVAACIRQRAHSAGSKYVPHGCACIPHVHARACIYICARAINAVCYLILTYITYFPKVCRICRRRCWV